MQKCLKECHGWKQFRLRLATEGISISFKVRQDGRVNGIVFTKENVSFGGTRTSPFVAPLRGSTREREPNKPGVDVLLSVSEKKPGY